MAETSTTAATAATAALFNALVWIDSKKKDANVGTENVEVGVQCLSITGREQAKRPRPPRVSRPRTRQTSTAMATDAIPLEVQSELTRLTNEVHAKDETLNQLKLKTKSFVDNMRSELAVEKKKVADLEGQLKVAKDAVNSSTSAAPSSSSSSSSSSSEVESLKKEMALVTQREHELKAKAKVFADNMKAQLQTEKERSHKLEQELAAKAAALALAQTSVATSNATHDLLSLGDPMPHAPNDSAQVAALQTQLQTAQHELATTTDRMRRAEDTAAQRAQDVATARGELEALQFSSEQHLAQLRNELTALERKHHEQLAAAATPSPSTTDAQSQLQDALAKHQDALNQLQQYKIENEHLQKQLLDKDYLLEQLESSRERADESERQLKRVAADLTAAQSALQAAVEATKPCGTCAALQQELTEVRTLYEKVNTGRSDSDAQLAEAQTALHAQQQSTAAATARVDELTAQNAALRDTIARHASDVQRLTTELATLEAEATANQTDRRVQHEQSVAAATASKQQLDTTLQELQTKYAQLERKNQELLATVDAVAKDSSDKRQKAKALVIALTNDKQTLVDARAELQREVERLRMELNQRNVETERRLKQLQDDNSQRVAQSTTTLQNLSDEVSTLKTTLAIVQESEKNQQRAKELAAAKRDVDDANKKRLAAKAETQRLAVELERVQQCLSHLRDHASTQSATSVRKLASLHDRVREALLVLEKRAQVSASSSSNSSNAKASANGNSSSSTSGRNNANGADDLEVEDLREPETAGMPNYNNHNSNSSNIKPTSPIESARHVEATIAGVNERLTLLVEAAEKLCDLALEQHDVAFKDVVIDKVTSLFTQCFSEKLRTAYAKVDETELFASDSDDATTTTTRSNNNSSSSSGTLSATRGS